MECLLVAEDDEPLSETFLEELDAAKCEPGLISSEEMLRKYFPDGLPDLPKV